MSTNTTFYYSDNTTSTTSSSTIYFYSYDRTKTLTSVEVGTLVTRLENQCFQDCTSLTDITIPSSVTTLGAQCFQGCTSLADITIPSSVTSLGVQIFYNCISLTSITIPSGVTSLGTYCFGSCTSLTSISIPTNVTTLGEYCFYNCTLLASITIPSSVTSLGIQCFSYCTSLLSIIFINQNLLTTIGTDTFVNVSATLQVTYLLTSGYNSLSTASKNLQTQMPLATTYSYYATSYIPTIISVPNNNIVKTLGDVSFNLNATSNNPSQISYESSNDLIASVNGNGVVNINSVGTCTITISQPSTDVYSSGSIFVTITVNPSTTTTIINVLPTFEVILGSLPFNLGATSNSSAPFSYVSSNSLIASVSDSGIATAISSNIMPAIITISQPEIQGFTSAVVTTQIYVNPSTPSNPVIIVNGIGIEYFLDSPSQYGAIVSDVVITQSLINGSDVNKIIVNNDPNMSLIKILIAID